MKRSLTIVGHPMHNRLSLQSASGKVNICHARKSSTAIIFWSRLAFALFFVGWVGASAQSQERTRGGTESPIVCSIRSAPTIEQGQTPKIAVEIVNRSNRAVYLVGSLDASESAWRYPYCFFQVVGPDGKPAVKPTGRCGNMNALREEDFVSVRPRAVFDPYQHIDRFGFFPPAAISPSTFEKVGEYRIRFHYSTEQTDIKQWLGDGRPNERLVKLLGQVPKVTIKSASGTSRGATARSSIRLENTSALMRTAW
jgi:hypothetical protein